MQISVRRAVSGDFPAVFALLGQLWPGAPLDEAVQKTIFENMLAEPAGYGLYVAEDENGSLAGFLSGTIRLNAWYSGALFYITAMVVNEALRGQKIGKKIIDQMLADCTAAGIKAVELDSTFPREGAHAFYERLGFERRGYSFRMLL